MTNLLHAIRRIALIATVLSLLIFNCASAQKSNTEILWDNYGVPHIYGKTTVDMYYAFGWAQMHNHANLILQLYGVARGRASEYWGPLKYWGTNFLKQDKVIREFDLPGLAKK